MHSKESAAAEGQWLLLRFFTSTGSCRTAKEFEFVCYFLVKKYSGSIELGFISYQSKEHPFLP